MFSLSDFIGLFGVTIILGSYLALQCQKLSATSYTYIIMNIVGSFGILYSLFFDWNLSAAIVEFAWIAISVIGLIRQMRA